MTAEANSIQPSKEEEKWPEPHDKVYRDVDEFLKEQQIRIQSIEVYLKEVEQVTFYLAQDPSTGQKVKLTRERFTQEAKSLLEAEFKKNMHWDKSQIQKLAQQLNYSEEKIYKWVNAEANKAKRK